MEFLAELAAWFTDPANWQGADGVPNRAFQHVWYSLAAVATAVAIGLPVGLWIGHTGKGGAVVINIANAGRSIPTFGIILLVVTLMGIGFLPLYIALVAFAAPPVLTNTYAGVREVDSQVRDAAFGMGMRPFEVLTKVEFPVAIPLIMTGVRTATTQTVATATLGAVVGMGSLGQYIVSGISSRNSVLITAGAILVAALALLSEVLFAGVQRLLTPNGLQDARAPVAASGAKDRPATKTLEPSS